MRMLRFRAWVFHKKEFGEVLSIHYEGAPHARVELSNGQIMQMFFESSYPDCELTQHTGLWDEDGANIYEGDIVAITPEGFDTKNTVVMWDDGKFVLDSFDEMIDLQEMLYNRHILGKVIGNIYENPELIGG